MGIMETFMLPIHGPLNHGNLLLRQKEDIDYLIDILFLILQESTGASLPETGNLDNSIL